MANAIAKVVVVAAVAAVGYMGWQIVQRNQSGTAAGGVMDMDAAEALGREVGAQIGSDIGRRVGEQTVANLDMSAGSTVAQAEPETTMPASETAAVEAAPASDVTSTEDMPAESAPTETVATETVASTETATPAEPAAPVEVAAAEPAPVPEPAPAPTETAPAPAAAETTASEPTPAAETAEVLATAEEAPAPKAAPVPDTRIPPLPPCAAASTHTWAIPSANSGVPIRYIGTASNDGSLGIVILSASNFSAANNPGNAIQIATDKGESISGNWTVGGNPKMLFTTGLKAGCYKLTLGSDLSNADGHKLGTEISGLVRVR